MDKQAVMISIRPEWCKLIAEGKKTVEVRKTFPRLKPPFKCYIYESSGSGRVGNETFNVWVKDNGRKAVIGEFVCDDIFAVLLHPACFAKKPTFFEAAISDACLTKDHVEEYGKGKDVFGWHITDLVIYDQPRIISEFYIERNTTSDCPALVTMKRPPQSWCYVY